MSKTKITLDHPITTAEGKELDHVMARRITVGDMRSTSHIKSEIEQEMTIISKITGLVIEDLDLLDLEDYKKLQATFPKSPV